MATFENPQKSQAAELAYKILQAKLPQVLENFKGTIKTGVPKVAGRSGEFSGTTATVDDPETSVVTTPKVMDLVQTILHEIGHGKLAKPVAFKGTDDEMGMTLARAEAKHLPSVETSNLKVNSQEEFLATAVANSLLQKTDVGPGSYTKDLQSILRTPELQDWVSQNAQKLQSADSSTVSNMLNLITGQTK
jgi:hypothetical protein